MFFLLSPQSWLMVIGLLALVIKSKSIKRKLTVTFVLIALLFTNNFIYSQLVLLWQSPVQAFPTKKYNAGIVLGGYFYFDGNGKGFFDNCADRFIEANKLFHKGVIKQLVVSGGSPSILRNEPQEADSVMKEFMESGIPSKCIIKENKSRNTYENAIFSKRILDSLHISPPYIVITSALHMPRALSVFRKAKMVVDAFPCDYKVVHQRFSLSDALIPNLILLDEWTLFIKEMVGLVVYRATGKA